uniref:Natterin-3-like n=1 Tax=Leptobrachium leishanense TaxID=445787 RepID=A0A8C5R4G5_9ANUR
MIDMLSYLFFLSQMKVTLACLLSLSWLLILANASALAPNEVNEASPDLNDDHEVVWQSVISEADNHDDEGKDPTADTIRHNVDLSMLRINEDDKQEVETIVTEAAPWDSRQLLYNDYINLKWMEWPGCLPDGAVSIRNDYRGRTDYVCSESGCSIGFYSPSLGAYCFYPNNGKEYRTSSFKVLVNEDNFELIQWQYGSYGDYPINPIGRCPMVFVGKNQYGLGKVVPESKALLIPFSGLEYSYDYYEVLHLYTNYHTQYIQNVNYLTHRVTYSSDPVKILASSTVINNVCQNVNRVVTVSKTTVNDQTWDIKRPTKAGVLSMLNTQVPYFSGQTVTFMSAEEFEWRDGVAQSKIQTHARSVEITVFPNQECDVVLQGRTIYANMPFKAELSRVYQNGEKRSTLIEGMFKNEQTDEVNIIVRSCRRIPNSAPCP